MTTNLAEFLYAEDLAETRDVANLTYRIQSVFTALNSRNPEVPNYAPDIVLLQEASSESAATFVSQLSARTGHTYRIAADALPGAGAWENRTSSPRIIRETAIAYNASTMTVSSSPAASLLGYAESDIPAGQSPSSWLSMRQSTVQLTQKSSSKRFGVYSAHYRPSTFVLNHAAYSASWTNFLKSRVQALYPGATPIIGGDLNSPNAFTTSFENDTPQGPGAYTIARPKVGSGDVIAAPMNLLTSGYDADYKRFDDDVAADLGATYFDNVDSFLECHYLFEDGQGTSAAAASIDGCTQRYYSDHDFAWAVFG